MYIVLIRFLVLNFEAKWRVVFRRIPYLFLYLFLRISEYLKLVTVHVKLQRAKENWLKY